MKMSVITVKDSDIGISLICAFYFSFQSFKRGRSRELARVCMRVFITQLARVVSVLKRLDLDITIVKREKNLGNLNKCVHESWQEYTS